MGNVWHLVRCKLGRHRWETVRVGGNRGKECRDCHDRIFDKPGPQEPLDAGKASDVSGFY